MKWCPRTDSNRGPIDYKSIALPAELQGHLIILYYKPNYVYLLKRLRAAYTHGKGLSGVTVRYSFLIPLNTVILSFELSESIDLNILKSIFNLSNSLAIARTSFGKHIPP